MKEQLTIEHLAPYLPYGLKIKEVSKGSFTCDPNQEDIIELSVNNISRFIGKKPYKCVSQKPLLRPLSDLDKTYKDELSYSEWLIEKYYTIGIENQINRIEEDIRWINQCDYLLILYLLDWNFDINGLIEKGLALDINKVNIN